MPLKTGRFLGNAEVGIDREKCTLCGSCVKVCKGAPLYLDEGMIKVDHNRIFGCIGCGQCMAICQNDAIKVLGRDMSPEDIVYLPPDTERASFDSLKALMLSRRSVRNYKDKEIEPMLITKILETASTAPNGLAASDVEVLVLNGRDKVSEFAKDIILKVKKYKWLFSPVMLRIYKPFLGKNMYDMISTFFHTSIETFVHGCEEGEDWMFYSAPLAIYFHCSPYADPADPYIPATYAMLAAQSLGLGSCLIGTTSYLLNYMGKDVKKKYGIPLENRNGIMLIVGYPDVKYTYAIKRRFADIRLMN